MEELSEERARLAKERIEALPDMATLDSAERDEYERFEALARELANTPKPKPEDESSD